MQSCGPLAVKQFAVGVKLENPSAGRNEFEGFDLILVLAKDRPGNAESPFKVPSSRAVLETDFHHGVHPLGIFLLSFSLSFYHIVFLFLIPATSRTGAGQNNGSR